MDSVPKATPKAMSSRLLTMKFMQRAAASSPTTPASPEQQRSAKRQKQSADDAQTEVDVDVNSLVDKRAIQAAISEEERIREAALDRAAEQAGDERWYLDYEARDHIAPTEQPLQITYVGWAYIDRIQSGETDVGVDDGDLISNGRRTYGNYKREVEVFIPSNLKIKSYLISYRKHQTMKNHLQSLTVMMKIPKMKRMIQWVQMQ